MINRFEESLKTFRNHGKLVHKYNKLIFIFKGIIIINIINKIFEFGESIEIKIGKLREDLILKINNFDFFLTIKVSICYD